jgi:hypothetical protein
MSFVWNNNMREKHEANANTIHTNASVLKRTDS